MNLGNLIPRLRQNRTLIGRPRSSNDNLETSLGVFSEFQDLYGDSDYTYYVLLIRLIDRAIVEGNLHTLSIEQQKLLEEYFKEANVITPDIEDITDDYDYDFDQLTKHIYVLDDFLGSFIGEENEQYSRYGTQQFHSTCQPFGKETLGINRTE